MRKLSLKPSELMTGWLMTGHLLAPPRGDQVQLSHQFRLYLLFWLLLSFSILS